MSNVSKNSGARKKATRMSARTPRKERKLAPKKRQGKSVSANAERVRIKTALDPMLLTGAAFNGGRGFHPKATIADLIVLMFEAPNHDGPMGRATPEKFIESVLLCAADESELISQASHGAISGELERIGLRANWRARVALELANRMRAAAETSRGAS